MYVFNHMKVAVYFSFFIIQITWIKCEEAVDNCIVQIEHDKSSTRRIPQSFLQNQEDCKTVLYEIKTRNSSIIYVSSSSYFIEETTQTHLSDPTNLPLQSEFAEGGSISIQFEEYSVLSNGREALVEIEKWYFTERDFTKQRQYLSRKPFLRISVTVTGDWTAKGIELYNEEVEFNISKSTTSNELGEISATVFRNSFKDLYYHPNHAYVFQIHKPPSLNSSSISLTLKLFDIDEGLGEYTLIGSGAVPFHGPPPLFISDVKNEKKVQVNDENAYIIFVASSTLKKKTSKIFNIKWKHRGTKISVIDEDEKPLKEDILQSIQVCIYNTTAAFQEFKKPKAEQFKTFRQELAEKSNEILNNLNLPSSNISSSRISFYRLSAIKRSEKIHKGGMLYVMLKVEGSGKGKAAFDREILEKIFSAYQSPQNSDGYEIGQCPKRKRVNSGFYAMIPIFCSIIFVAWIWNQKSFSQYFVKIGDRNLSVEIEQDMIQGPTEENIYSQYPQSVHMMSVPRMHLTDVQGRRLTLNFDDTVDKLDSDPSNVMDLLNSGLLGVRSRRLRAEINEGFVDDEGNTLPKHTANEAGRNDTENVYDSLKSSRSVNKIYDTKL